jgi:hypothetical protein
MFCSDKENRTYRNTYGLRARILSVLCTRTLRRCLHSPSLENWNRKRGMGTSVRLDPKMMNHSTHIRNVPVPVQFPGPPHLARLT